METLYKQTISAARRRAERALKYAETSGNAKAVERLYKIIQDLKFAEMRGLHG